MQRTLTPVNRPHAHAAASARPASARPAGAVASAIPARLRMAAVPVRPGVMSRVPESPVMSEVRNFNRAPAPAPASAAIHASSHASSHASRRNEPPLDAATAALLEQFRSDHMAAREQIEKFTDAVSYTIMTNPVIFKPCNHIFDRSTYDQLPHPRTCPYCRTPINGRKTPDADYMRSLNIWRNSERGQRENAGIRGGKKSKKNKVKRTRKPKRGGKKTKRNRRRRN